MAWCLVLRGSCICGGLGVAGQLLRVGFGLLGLVFVAVLGAGWRFGCFLLWLFGFGFCG